MNMGPQAVLHKKSVLQRRNNGEGKRRAQENCAQNPDPAHRMNRKQHHEKDRGNLRKSGSFAEEAVPKVAQSSNGKQHRAGRQYGDVAAENQHSKRPRNFVQNRKHRKHRAQQKLVSNGIEILAKQSLLVQLAGEEAIEAVAESGNHENNIYNRSWSEKHHGVKEVTDYFKLFDYDIALLTKAFPATQ